ncbi:phenylalanine--tRNA ligase subunit alpha [bacterium]|nr:phenylalanine--tRNA ligase subunit alpha [bacterium]
MKEQLGAIYKESSEAAQKVEDLKQLEDLRIRILGRKGQLTLLLHGLKTLPSEERRIVGQAANDIKNKLLQVFDDRMQVLKRASWSADSKLRPDATLPGRPVEMGREHILNRTLHEIEGIFKVMGFSVAEGPEVETEYYNFEAMNFPADHPSRDMHDTLFIDDGMLLRTHTSPVQVRYMEKQKPPIRAIMPGKTYRCDDDATHSPMFHQVEGLMVDTNVSFTDLKAVLTFFIHRMFGEDANLRFRPSFFPFTEPSAEIDMTCVNCHGQGCSLCKGTGWMEILGAGMVHPNVLWAGKIDPEQYTGFAFGMGVERITMLKYGIDNMRYFFENDLRFLRQF